MDAWDVTRDLHFLFATDEQLNDDLSYVCLLLSKPNDEEKGSETKSSEEDEGIKPQKKINKFRARQQAEITQLREEVHVLKTQIESMKQSIATRKMSPWELAARDELVSRNAAWGENVGLRQQVRETATFIEDIQQRLIKKPRLMDGSGVSWREFKLAAQESLRTAAIHAIADQEYSKLQSSYIRAGLFGKVDDILRTRPVVVCGKSVIEYAHQVTIGAPYDWIDVALWDIFQTTEMESCDAEDECSKEIMEHVDANTFYSAYTQPLDGNHQAHSNIVSKHYVEHNRRVIVWRSILDDALVPRMREGDVLDEWGSILCEPRDANSCTIKTLTYCGGTATSLYPRDEFVLSGDTLAKVDSSLFPIEATLLGMKAFEKRSKEIENEVQRAIDMVVDMFQKTTLQDTDNIETSTWNVYQDLHFLFVNDEALNTELSYVCDLLSEQASDETSQSPRAIPCENEASTSKRKKRNSSTPMINPSRIRQKQQINLLRQQVFELKKQLLEAERDAATQFDVTKWKRIARQELFEKSKALQENEELRAEVQQQATFIEEMEKFFRKKPRLTLHSDTQSEEWKACKLAAQASLRIAAIHAIADRQYRRQQSAYVAAGIFDRTEDLIRGTPMPQPDNSLLLEYVYHVTLAAPFYLIGSAVWKVFNGELGPQLPSGATQTWERIDENTAYHAFTRRLVGNESVVVHSNIVWKNYIEEERRLVVWRAVLDDALVPHMANGAIHDEWGWAVVTPIDATSCRFSMLLQIVTDPEQKESRGRDEDLIEETLHQMKTFSFVEPPEEPGRFPGTPLKDMSSVDAIDLSFYKRTFMERGKRLELALKDAIDQVIRQHEGNSMEE